MIATQPYMVKIKEETTDQEIEYSLFGRTGILNNIELDLIRSKQQARLYDLSMNYIELLGTMKHGSNLVISGHLFEIVGGN